MNDGDISLIIKYLNNKRSYVNVIEDLNDLSVVYF